MKKLAIAFLAMTAILFLANWGSRDTNFDGPQKEAINFYGVLETWQGQRYTVENISIDHRIKQIAMYEKPATIAADKSEDPASHGYNLKQNPTKNFVKTKIDLHEVKSLEIPDPEHPWVYKKRNGMQETEYLEIVVTSKGSQGQADITTSYLIEARKKLYCDRIIGPCPEEREVPLAAMKKLVIEGYKYREPEQDNRCRPTAAQPVETPAIRPVA
jgi:hypothetical protein